MDKSGGSGKTVRHLIKQFESHRINDVHPLKIKKSQSLPFDINKIGDAERMFNFNEILSKVNVLLKEYDQITSDPINDAKQDDSLNSTRHHTTLRSISEKYTNFQSNDDAQFKHVAKINSTGHDAKSNVDIDVYITHLHEIVELLLPIGRMDCDTSTRSEKLSCLETLEDLHVNLKEITRVFSKGAGDGSKKSYLLRTNFRESLDSIRLRVHKLKLNEMLKNAMNNRNESL